MRKKILIGSAVFAYIAIVGCSLFIFRASLAWVFSCIDWSILTHFVLLGTAICLLVANGVYLVQLVRLQGITFASRPGGGAPPSWPDRRSGDTRWN